MNTGELLLELVLMPLVAFLVGLLLVLMMRKVRAKIERRVGPPFFQPVYDIVKLYAKKTQISHGYMHDVAMMMLLGGYIASEIFLPVPGMDGVAHQADLLTLMYLLMVPMLGMAMGVGQTANPNGSIGISRALTSMLAYDIPFVIVVAGAAIHYGTTSLPTIIEIQQQQGLQSWGLTTMPLLALAGLMTMHAMLGKEPFELYVAPAEIATGPMVEMSGKYMGTLFVMQCFQLYTVGVLYTTLFLGGGLNWLTFLPKVFAVVLIAVSITNVYGRYRTEDAVRWLWKWPVMIALAGLALVMSNV
ncbi:respiratory chain complex I subunit 1 family protein [Candidatus Venteria ishoeyi]|uniref:NADH-quinone oxidoreductase subunit H n=1 Tax=Candidatus Venteria ishoeyi TaxID=1899563 RepID=A0A1H6FFA2_9GAMM|nr:NADH-quinone oxidoreductase subunit H [Candidatus Venteria ishoeyi]MDM8547072.1 NADH-quinone oxidoreductase subunit H [Candidatus Venteria ishoeyi]SEH07715.1 NADH-quinone oxidoreductase subunit H [Candidatus Venteria ishoeyi]